MWTLDLLFHLAAGALEVDGSPEAPAALLLDDALKLEATAELAILEGPLEALGAGIGLCGGK